MPYSTPQKLLQGASRKFATPLATRSLPVVLDASSLGAQAGWESLCAIEAAGRKRLRSVRAQCVLGRQSSKRIQTGEPIRKASFHDKSRPLFLQNALIQRRHRHPAINPRKLAVRCQAARFAN